MQSEIWNKKRVLVTGYTGFKGGWLSLWLDQMGAEVHGIALAPDTDRSLHTAANIGSCVNGRLVDLRDADAVEHAVAEIQPQIVFHLAAQPLVRQSYDQPVVTFATNVMGTVNLLESCRAIPELEAIICVTTDKVYHNHEWVWPYRETDSLGGKDPYSASKAAVEILVGAYRNSFYKPLDIPLVTARGGNVIGGGDWAIDRLVPDLIRAAVHEKPMEIRSPESVRPWQHVLVLCHGYLILGEKAILRTLPDEGAWNFGPLEDDCVSVRELLNAFEVAGLPHAARINPNEEKPESRFLSLDSSLARTALNWRPALHLKEAVEWTADWYKQAEKGDSMQAMTLSQIRQYAERLRS